MSLKTEVRRVQSRAIDSLKSASRELSHAVRELMATEVGKTLGVSTAVRALMTTEVQWCRTEDTLEQAARVMWEHDRGALPVLDQGRVISMLTDRDICMATFTQNKRPSELGVTSAMSQQLYTCSPDDSLGSALATMAHQRLRRLPVTSPKGELQGILSIADIVRWANALADSTVHAVVADAEEKIAQSIPVDVAVAAE